MRHPLRWLLAVLCVLAAVAPAAAAPSVADFQVYVTAGVTSPQVIQNGGTATVTGLEFEVGLTVDNDGGEEASARARFTLPEGLRFGSDAPDPTEGCTLVDRVAECLTGITIGTDPSRRTAVWGWDAVADRAGSYVLRAEVVETSVTDPSPANNATSATVVVRQATTPPPPPGGGGATASASAVKLTPSRPRAGAAVVAAVRVSADGAPLRPTAIVCAGSIGAAKVKGTAKATRGTAACSYRTPRSAKDKTLKGSVAFRAGGTRFTKRFSARLR